MVNKMIGKSQLEKLGMGIRKANNESTHKQKLWGVIDGKIIEVKVYNNNDNIKQFKIRNGKIIQDITKKDYDYNANLHGDENIITVGKTSISITSVKYKKHDYAIRYTPIILQIYKGNGIERHEYYSNTLLINPKFIKSTLKYARNIEIIKKIKKKYSKQELIEIIIEIIHYLKQLYKNNQKHDKILLYEKFLDILRHYPKKEYRIINITNKPKYLKPYKKIRDIEEKREYPQKPKGRKPKRKTITFRKFKELINNGKMNAREFRNYIVLN